MTKREQGKLQDDAKVGWSATAHASDHVFCDRLQVTLPKADSSGFTKDSCHTIYAAKLY
jgi:hypothetical protein